MTVLDYWNQRDKLSFTDDIVFKEQEIVIPESLRYDNTISAHVGHFGRGKKREDGLEI